MITPSASELLEVWERGQGASSVARALLLLAAAEPTASADDLAGLSIGARDARLLRLRARLFGTTLECVASCPACNELLELNLSTQELLRAHTRDVHGSQSVDVDGVPVRYRLPNSTDLLALAGVADGGAARAMLLERCIEQAHDSPLSSTITESVVAEMAATDPLADLELDLNCPSCAARWLAPFDVVGFLWHEVDSWAQRALREVHTLARAYGWGELEILALSPARRRAYLDLVAAAAHG